TPVEGGPGWVGSERYTINAKAEGQPDQATMKGPMLQAVLEDRFQLKIHRETREIPVYRLTVAKGGPKLQPVKEADCHPFDLAAAQAAAAVGKTLPRSCGSIWFGASTDRPGSLFAQAHGISLDAFSKNLSRTLDRPVIDKTGIAGLYDLRVEFAPDETTPRFQPGGGQGWLAGSPGAASDPAGPRLSTALQQQLGLKLEPAKGSGEFVVIDHVERPSEN
ncbi:MAG TPA: TIGR03435 family protein, partial [Bryobacteraceae bacterium]|nr:TIGR03435 family protein [Bryobacteraceae bacterium]